MPDLMGSRDPCPCMSRVGYPPQKPNNHLCLSKKLKYRLQQHSQRCWIKNISSGVWCFHWLKCLWWSRILLTSTWCTMGQSWGWTRQYGHLQFLCQTQTQEWDFFYLIHSVLIWILERCSWTFNWTREFPLLLEWISPCWRNISRMLQRWLVNRGDALEQTVHGHKAKPLQLCPLLLLCRGICSRKSLIGEQCHALRSSYFELQWVPQVQHFSVVSNKVEWYCCGHCGGGGWRCLLTTYEPAGIHSKTVLGDSRCAKEETAFVT